MSRARVAVMQIVSKQVSVTEAAAAYGLFAPPAIRSALS